MADHENAVIAVLDDANARQHRIRQRARWLVDGMSDRELRKFGALLEDMIRATNETQADLKELRRLEHEKPSKAEMERRRQHAYIEDTDLYQQLM